MTPDLAHARELAREAVERTTSAGAVEAEAVVTASSTALTRFANNRVHQNVASEDLTVSVRAIVHTRVGVATTNRTSPEGLAACCEAAVEAARRAPEDPRFPGLPGPLPVDTPDRAVAATRAMDPGRRAETAAAIIEESSSRGLSAAGQVAVADEAAAVANSLGIDVAMPVTRCRATVLSMGPGGGSGWASFASRDASLLRPSELGAEAAALAERSAFPSDLAPGSYPVVLGPEAVGDLVQFIGWDGCSAKAVEEGRSFMSGRIGEKVMSAAVTIVDDATSSDSAGLTFDWEGVPKSRVPLIEKGVVRGPVTDSYWAAMTGRPDTGHALPAPNQWGPIPVDLEMSPGASTLEELVGAIDYGVYVTRFHYVNVEDPTRVTLTGMTRDGAFLIENGSVTNALRDLRFTQSVVEAFSGVEGVSAQRRLVGEDAFVLAPYVRLAAFAFTGRTE
jgi:PmbA protein